MISVIVPVFNVADYLMRCVDSLLAQDEPSFELILVDDGSTDGSSKLCDDAALQDSRIRVVHTENHGVASARNRGIETAKGEYVAFVDADDYVAPTFLSTLLQGIEQSGAQFAACKNKRVRQDETPAFQSQPEHESFVCSGVDALGHALLGEKISGSMCDKLFKRSFIGDHRFASGLIYEDALLASELMPKADKVFVTTQVGYYYSYREGSAIMREFNKTDFDAIKVYSGINDMVANRYPSILPQSEFRLLWAHFVVLDKILTSKRYKEALRENKELLLHLKGKVVRVVKDPYFRTTRKIGALALRINWRLYRLMVIFQATRR